MNKAPAAPETYQLFYDNDYPANTTSTIKNTISTTVSIHVGESMKISAGIPGIMNVADTFTWSFDMETENTDSKTTKESFSWSGVIPEDAMSTTMVQFTV